MLSHLVHALGAGLLALTAALPYPAAALPLPYPSTFRTEAIHWLMEEDPATTIKAVQAFLAVR